MVAAIFLVEGIYHQLPAGKDIVVYSRNHVGGTWSSPSKADFSVDGTWTVNITLTGQNIGGASFEIGVKFLDILAITNRRADTGDFVYSDQFHHIITVTAR